MFSEKQDTSVEKDRNSGSYAAGLNALTKSLHAAFILLTLAIAGIIVWYFIFGGYFTVSTQENVIVLRFGKIVNVHKEGWYWTFPYPVSRIVRIPVSKQTIRTISFWHNADIKGVKSPNPPGDAEMGGGPLVPGKDGYLLTGDANIIHTEWEMFYAVADPLKYYTKCVCPSDPGREDDVFVHPVTGKIIGSRGPKTLLRTLLDNAILKITAFQEIDAALYKDSFFYAATVEEELRKELVKWDLGVSVDDVIFKSKTAPLATVSAFHRVLEAEAESSSEKQKAKAYAGKIKNETDAECSEVIADAKVYRRRTVSGIESENIYFKKILAEYGQNPKSVLLALYTDTISALLESVKDKYVIPKNGTGGQELRIMLNPEPKYKQKEKEKTDD